MLRLAASGRSGGQGARAPAGARVRSLSDVAVSTSQCHLLCSDAIIYCHQTLRLRLQTNRDKSTISNLIRPRLADLIPYRIFSQIKNMTDFDTDVSLIFVYSKTNAVATAVLK